MASTKKIRSAKVKSSNISRVRTAKSPITSFSTKPGILAIVAGVLILVGGLWVLFTSASSPATPSGYKEVFKDDFDGSTLNTAVWKPYYSTYGDANKEEACLTPNNVSVSNGSLKIVAKRESITCPGQPTDQFSSGFLGTRENGVHFPKFARYEMRAKLPHAQGLWPAFWLRHKNGSSIAEVDVMEYFHAQAPGKTTATIHLDNAYNISKKTTAFENPTTTPGWHTWAVEMEPDATDATKVKFSFSLDATVYHTVTPSQKTWATATDANKMFDIALNLAVGGNYVGHPDDDLGWSRYLNACLKPYKAAAPCDAYGISRASFPSTYEIDYVRVMVKDSSTPSTTVTPTATTTITPSPTNNGAIATPTNLVADGVVNGANLSWTKSADTRVDEYSVRYIRSDSTTKADGSTWVYPGRTSGISQGITGLTPGVSYDFQVRAIDNMGTADSSDDAKSDYTASAFATPEAEPSPTPTTTTTVTTTPTTTTTVSPSPTTTTTPPPTTDTTAPSTPTNVKASVVFDALRFSYYNSLRWTASYDNVGVSRYLIKRNGTQIGTSTTTKFQDYNIAANTPYSYEIYAQDAAGNTSQAGAARLVGKCFLIWCWAE
jgi:beta-glucanase (GH16 family)